MSTVSLPAIVLSSCERFHQLLGKPLYTARFIRVEKFHAPGLAPAYDASGAYHIDTTGKAAYNKRFLQIHGFYNHRAAVQDETGFYHIDPKGNSIYTARYQWVGNFQEEKCVVNDANGFFHIDLKGASVYPEIYDYVGDFKESAAVVYKNGQATHINQEGKWVHAKWYKRLHVFHKGYAMAKDAKGWLHINRQGQPLYSQHFKRVEPFYNGRAKVETREGTLGQIDRSGTIQLTIATPHSLDLIHDRSAELASFWKTYLIHAAVTLGLCHSLPCTTAALAQQLTMAEESIERLLRALWEIGWITYEPTKAIWQLTTKGHSFKTIPFLAKAATLWGQVAAAANWLKLPDLLRQSSITSFPSFKEKERSIKKKKQYYEALLGYAAWDFQVLHQKIEIQAAKHVLLFGVRALALIAIIGKQNKNLLFHYYHDPPLPKAIIQAFNVTPKGLQSLTAQYDMAIFCQFLQHYDDATVITYLQLAKKQTARLCILETILAHDKPTGGMVDINTMVETGGKLRTLAAWKQLFGQVGACKRTNVIAITDYLTLVDVCYAE
ncbi:MAG: WG repeat-containing protein [Candidatus Cardinium sp.]|nr:WG repeat-containing protein [Candidatus Cardinium sp.]